MKKLWILVMIILIVPFFSFAGGQQESEIETGEEPITLTIWGRDMADDDPSHMYQKALVDDWNDEFGGEILLDYVPNPSQLFDKLQIAFAGDEGPDIFQSWGGTTMGAWADEGYLMPLTEELSDIATSEAARNAMSWKGETYGVAPYFAVGGLFINEGIFENLGLEIPTTIAELEHACDVLLANEIQPFAIGAKGKWPILALYMYLTNRYGGYAFDRALNREIPFNNDEFIKAGNIYKDWINKGYFGPRPLSEDYSTASLLMQTGRAAMQVTGSWKGVDYSDSSSTDQKIGIYAFPIAEGGIGKATDVMGQTDIGWVATKYAADKKDAVVQFMHYAMSKDLVSQDPSRITSVPGIENTNHLTTMASELLGSAKNITFWWDQNLPSELTTPMQDAMQEFMLPSTTVEDALSNFESLAVDYLGPVQQ